MRGSRMRRAIEDFTAAHVAGVKPGNQSYAIGRWRWAFLTVTNPSRQRLVFDASPGVAMATPYHYRDTS